MSWLRLILLCACLTGAICSVPLAGVVLTTGKDTRVFEKSIESALKHLVDIDKFYIITPDAKQVHEKLHSKLGSRVVFVDESQFPFRGDNVSEVMVGAVKDKGVYPLSGTSPFEKTLWGRTGWFLQQLLKLYAGKVLGLEDFVILDSDLIWFQDVTFFNRTLPDGTKVYNYASSGQYHNTYIATLKRVAGVELFDPQNDVFRSGIVHHMVVVKRVLDDLMTTSENLHHGLPFWKIMLNQSAVEMTCRAPRASICGAGSTLSEYELYFNYARMKFPQTLVFRPLMWANGPMPGLLFWPPIEAGKISSDKHRTHYMNHRQPEVMQAFDRQIHQDALSGYHYIGYHGYAKRRYYEMVDRKLFHIIFTNTAPNSLNILYLCTADYQAICNPMPKPFNTTCSWRGFEDRVNKTHNL